MASRTSYYYWLVEPVRPKFQNPSSVMPVFAVPISLIGPGRLDVKACSVSAFVDPDGRPICVRLTIPELEEEETSEKVLDFIHEVQEHALAMMRLTYYMGVTFFPYVLSWSLRDGEEHAGVEVFKSPERPRFDGARMGELFVATFGDRVDVNLFVDGFASWIPLQYRYLSFYKILENRFRKRGRWDKKRLDQLLTPYADDAKRLGIRGSLVNHLHALRDRCAHIKTNKDAVGVTHLNREWAAKVQTIMPLIANICVAVLNEAGKGRFSFAAPPASESGRSRGPG